LFFDLFVKTFTGEVAEKLIDADADVTAHTTLVEPSGRECSSMVAGKAADSGTQGEELSALWLTLISPWVIKCSPQT